MAAEVQYGVDVQTTMAIYWLGLEFVIRTEVKCVVFIDGNSDDNNKSNEAQLQKEMQDEYWVDVMSFKQHVYPIPLESTTSSEQWRVFDNDNK